MDPKGVLVDQFLSKPINLAHSFARRAEECEENGDLAKAVEYHGKAAVVMQDVLSANEQELDFQVNSSLKLQFNYHKNREKFLIAVNSYRKNEEQATMNKDQNTTDLNCDEETSKKDGSTNFSLLEKQIQTGSLIELRKISSKLFELVKIQQEQIIYLSQQLQMFNAENMALKKAWNE